MTNRRPIIAALFALTAVAGGIAATGSAGAQNIEMPRRSTTTKAPSTVPMCYGGSNCTPRTKNAALPTTTAAKKATATTVKKKTTKPTVTATTKPKRTKNAALPPTTTRPKTVTTPMPKLPTNTIKR